MSDPEFATIAARFLSRVTTAIQVVRSALEHNDQTELQRGLQNLSAAAGMFGYQDISSLALRAEALCELRPLPVAIVTELLDAIDDARCVHIMSSASYGHEPPPERAARMQ